MSHHLDKDTLTWVCRVCKKEMKDFTKMDKEGILCDECHKELNKKDKE